MSATAARLHPLTPPTRPYSGLIFEFPRHIAGQANDQSLTADRPAGVGSPTIAPPCVGVLPGFVTARPDRADLPVEADALLLAESVEAGLSAVAALDAEARSLARQFRFMPSADAQRKLADIVESTRSLQALAAMLARISGNDLRVLCERHGHAAVTLHRAVSNAVRAQLAADYESVAHALDSDLTAALRSWRRVFDALQPLPAFDDGPSGHAA